MGQALTLHPGSRCMAATRIEVEIGRPSPSNLVLHYSVTGRISGLRMPPSGAPTRAEELWQHTCFEVFVRAPPSAAYYEFNFAPSMQWAAYRFSAYRHEMSVADDIHAPRIEAQSRDGLYQLRASLSLGGLSSLPTDAAWRLGLSAVIEETNGRKSYWALAHPPGKPDFHHPDCFAYELPAASPP
jgi:hypothetical protein